MLRKFTFCFTNQNQTATRHKEIGVTYTTPIFPKISYTPIWACLNRQTAFCITIQTNRTTIIGFNNQNNPGNNIDGIASHAMGNSTNSINTTIEDRK